MIIWPIFSIFPILVFGFGDVVMDDDIVVYIFEAVCPLSVYFTLYVNIIY